MARILETAAALLLATTLASPTMAADAVAGAKNFKQACAVCHATATSGIGPALGGIVGRKVGTLPGYASRYSPAMKAAGFVWTHEKLEHYIDNPASVVPGNHMPYAGMHNLVQADAVVDYLQTLK